MYVTLTKTYRFSPNGNDIVELEAGVHDMEERWGNKAIASEAGVESSADEVKEAKKQAAAEKREAKTKGNAPENKAAK